jgi:hypothetical protein
VKVQHINEAFTAEEMHALRSVKGSRTWRDAILEEFGVDTEAEVARP